MDGWEGIAGILAFVAAVLAIVFKLIMRQRADLNLVKDALADFREKIAERYASVKHLSELEKRIIDRIGSMERRMEKLINSTPRSR